MKAGEYEVVFEIDLLSNIIMKIISNGKIVFYEKVTDDVLEISNKFLKGARLNEFITTGGN
ncbi:hypothetical protein ACT7DP_29940 [Bacillus paranthracis]